MASRIAELATEISENTAKVDSYLKSHNLPQPSFEADGPIELSLPPQIERSRIASIEASIELQQLLEGPKSLTRPMVNATSLQAIYKYEIAQKVPVGDGISFFELAKLCDLHETDLRRILRYAMYHHRLFKEPQKGIVVHSAASRLLAEDLQSRDAIGQLFDSLWPASAHTVEALQRFKGQEPNETGHALAFNTNLDFFEYLAVNPLKEKRFANAMAALTTQPGQAVAFLKENFSWNSFGNALIVDVGGSGGHISIELARAFPSLRFIVQDRSEVIEKVKAQCPADVKNRVQFMAHDFFNPQPVEGDIFFFRWIFHNWPDKYVIKILRQLIGKLKPGARVLLNEHVLPEPNTMPLTLERNIRYMDMSMLSLCNSRERDRDDWIAIFQEADKRFRVLDVNLPHGSTLGIVDVVWEK